MSLIGSLLAFVLIPLKAKPKEAENLAVMALADEVRRLQFALDHWRNAGSTLMEENERLREELRNTREHRDWLMEHWVYQHQNAQQAQQNALMAQQANLQQQAYQGLDQLQSAYDCTCVPARAEALKR